MPNFDIQPNTLGAEETHTRMRISTHGFTRINFLKLKVNESKAQSLKNIFQKAINEIVELSKKYDKETGEIYKKMKSSPNDRELMKKLRQRVSETVSNYEKKCSAVMKELDNIPLPDKSSIKNN